MLRLSKFIREKSPEILFGWDEFAKTLSPAADDMSIKALRDHAREMLADIAVDIETPQSAWEEKQKSNGMQVSVDVENTAASVHGVGRSLSPY